MKNSYIRLSFRILSQDRNTPPKIIDRGVEIDPYQAEAQDILSKIVRVSKRGKKLISKSNTTIYSQGSEFCIEAPTTEKDFTGQRNVRFMVYGKLNPNFSKEIINSVSKQIEFRINNKLEDFINKDTRKIILKEIRNRLNRTFIESIANKTSSLVGNKIETPINIIVLEREIENEINNNSIECIVNDEIDLAENKIKTSITENVSKILQKSKNSINESMTESIYREIQRVVTHDRINIIKDDVEKAIKDGIEKFIKENQVRSSNSFLSSLYDKAQQFTGG